MEKDNTKPGRIKKALLREILVQNQEMRKLLEEWPARMVMMEYEKDWNDRRLRLLEKSSIHDPSELGLE